MSATGLFILGTLVTLIVAAAMAVLVYAAILDGRDAAARKAVASEAPAAPGATSSLQTARGAGRFDTLVTATDRAGSSGMLEHDGPFTVIAPIDEAVAISNNGVVGSTAPASSLATSKHRTQSSTSSTACSCRHASERSTRK